MGNVDTDQTPLYVASDQGLHGLPYMYQILEIKTSSKTDVFKFWDQYGKELNCLCSFNTEYMRKRIC